MLLMQVTLVALAMATTLALLVLARKHVTQQTFELAAEVKALEASRTSLLATIGELREQYDAQEREALETRRELISLATTVSGCESYAYCQGCKEQAYEVRRKYLGDNERCGPYFASLDDDEADWELNGQLNAHVWAWVARSEESGCIGCNDRRITAPEGRCGYCRAGFESAGW